MAKDADYLAFLGTVLLVVKTIAFYLSELNVIDVENILEWPITITNQHVYIFSYFLALLIYLSAIGSIKKFEKSLKLILVIDLIISSVFLALVLYYTEVGITAISKLYTCSLLTLTWCLSSFIIFTLIPAFEGK